MTFVEQRLVEVVGHKIENNLVEQRLGDGYINATAMCKAAGKSFSDYVRNRTAVEFLNELSSDMGIPISDLVQSIRGGKSELQGTWVHPQVAIHLAQWLSSKFAVRVSKWVHDWLTGESKGSSLPYHLRRYVANMDKIPSTHFSILNEMIMHLIAPLERLGYTMPDRLVPDISEGKMFCRFLREEMELEPKDFPKYKHLYENGKTVEANLYPVEILPAFRRHFFEVWLPKRAVTYFSRRDPEAIDHLKIMLALQTKIEVPVIDFSQNEDD